MEINLFYYILSVLKILLVFSIKCFCLYVYLILFYTLHELAAVI
jgi:hypothetical protein